MQKKIFKYNTNASCHTLSNPMIIKFDSTYSELLTASVNKPHMNKFLEEITSNTFLQMLTSKIEANKIYRRRNRMANCVHYCSNTRVSRMWTLRVVTSKFSGVTLFAILITHIADYVCSSQPLSSDEGSTDFDQKKPPWHVLSSSVLWRCYILKMNMAR